MVKILLDPGHGTQNRGFVNINGFNFCSEGMCNYYYAIQYLKPALEKYGIQVGLTKSKMSQDPSLVARGRKGQGYDMLLSLHSNAGGGRATGTEIYDSVNHKERLTQFFGELSAVIANACGTNNRGVKYRSNSKGGNYYGILRHGMAKHNAIIEHAFHDNYTDAQRYVRNLDKIAQATAQKIAQFYGLTKGTSAPTQNNNPSIMGVGTLTADQMKNFVLKNNPNPKLTVDIGTLVNLYIKEAKIEGVNHDIAFAQAIKETGFFKYGGDVTYDQNNYAGIGTTGGGVKGHYFPTAQVGVQAQIQHLKAYATREPLVQKCVDPRYDLVAKGIAPNVCNLNGKWAVPGNGYGESIVELINAMRKGDSVKMNEVRNDVVPNWAKEDFERAKELGITDGTRPNDNATRVEVAAMIVRALELKK